MMQNPSTDNRQEVAILVEPQQTEEGRVGEATEWLVRGVLYGNIVLTEGFLLADDMPIAKDVAGKLVISSGYTNSVPINRHTQSKPNPSERHLR